MPVLSLTLTVVSLPPATATFSAPFGATSTEPLFGWMSTTAADAFGVAAADGAADPPAADADAVDAAPAAAPPPSSALAALPLPPPLQALVSTSAPPTMPAAMTLRIDLTSTPSLDPARGPGGVRQIHAAANGKVAPFER
ncbi:hypothetical protein GCM10010505_03560 [Kitasatospora aburaviensis]